MKFDRKQDLNVLYLVCVFRADQYKKNCRPGRSVKKVAQCTQVHDMWPFVEYIVGYVHIIYFSIVFVTQWVSGGYRARIPLSARIFTLAWRASHLNYSHTNEINCDIHLASLF